MILWDRFDGTCVVHECFGAKSSQLIDPSKLRIAHFRKRVMGRGGVFDSSMVSLTNQLKKTLKELWSFLLEIAKIKRNEANRVVKGDSLFPCLLWSHYWETGIKWITALSYNWSTSVMFTRRPGIEGCSTHTWTKGSDKKVRLIRVCRSSSEFPLKITPLFSLQSTAVCNQTIGIWAAAIKSETSEEKKYTEASSDPQSGF